MEKPRKYKQRNYMRRKVGSQAEVRDLELRSEDLVHVLEDQDSETETNRREAQQAIRKIIHSRRTRSHKYR